MFTTIEGGNFLQGFATGALSSLAGSGWGEVFGKSGGSMVAFSAVAGGVIEELQGGDFVKGFSVGLTIGALNHMLHEVKINPSAEVKAYVAFIKSMKKLMLTIQKGDAILQGHSSDWYTGNNTLKDFQIAKNVIGGVLSIYGLGEAFYVNELTGTINTMGFFEKSIAGIGAIQSFNDFVPVESYTSSKTLIKSVEYINMAADGTSVAYSYKSLLRSGPNIINSSNSIMGTYDIGGHFYNFFK